MTPSPTAVPTQFDRLLFPVLDAAFDGGAHAYRTGQDLPPADDGMIPLLPFAWQLGWKFERFMEGQRRGRR